MKRYMRHLWLNQASTADKSASTSRAYSPNQFTGTIVLKNGCSWMRVRPDRELVNNKPGRESSRVVNWSLISGVHYDYAGNKYPIPQTMAGVGIDVDFDEFQEWYKSFTTFVWTLPCPVVGPHPSRVALMYGL